MSNSYQYVLNAKFTRDGGIMETCAEHPSIAHLKYGFEQYMQYSLKHDDKILEGAIYRQWPDGRRDEVLSFDTVLGAWIVKLPF